MESASSQQQRNISDLPIGALSHVSSYLALPSRALLAVALNYRDTDGSTAIVGEHRDVLDFGDTERVLAAKLTDDDVKGVLLSIDAVNNLKILRLTNLLNITGIGLEPLQGSITIEKIDLSLVGDNQSPDISPVPPISCNEVLPILNGIIDMGGACSLKLLTFPKKWRKERNTEFRAFLDQYNEFLRSREVTCLKCEENMGGATVSTNTLVLDYGTQDVTCYDCMKHYCHECVEEEDGEEIYCMSDLCNICIKRYCLHCYRVRECTSCAWFCVDCMDMKPCAQCEEIVCLNCISKRSCRSQCCEGKIWCDHCVQYEDALVACENCDAEYCNNCDESNPNVQLISYCGGCDRNFCRECRVIKSREGMRHYCEECHRFVLKATLEDKERKIQEMQAEINKLKRKVKDMNGELEDNE